MDSYITKITEITPYTLSQLFIFLAIIIFSVLIFLVKLYILTLVTLALRKYLKTYNVNKRGSKIKKLLGESIKDHRIKSKMTKEFIAETIGVEKETVSNWENNSVEPNLDNIFCLAKLFEINVDELFQNVTNKYNKI